MQCLALRTTKHVLRTNPPTGSGFDLAWLSCLGCTWCYMYKNFRLHPFLYLLVCWVCGIVPWPGRLSSFSAIYCWLGHLTCKIVAEMTYNVSSWTLNPTISYPEQSREKLVLHSTRDRAPHHSPCTMLLSGQRYQSNEGRGRHQKAATKRRCVRVSVWTHFVSVFVCRYVWCVNGYRCRQTNARRGDFRLFFGDCTIYDRRRWLVFLLRDYCMLIGMVVFRAHFN